MIINALEHSEEFEKILFSSGFLGQKIYADFITQKNSSTNSFYMLNNCAFMLSGVNLTLCGDVAQDDIVQIISFCRFFHLQTIESQLKNLPLSVDKKLIIMQYTSQDKPPYMDIIKNEDIYSFIQFCCENFDGISFDTSYSNFVRKVNGKVSNIYYIKKDNKIISGAVATEYFDNTEYITFVSTEKQYRKQGFCKKVLNHIISQSSGKKILLKCEEHLCDFYAALGFEKIDSLTINTLKEN